MPPISPARQNISALRADTCAKRGIILLDVVLTLAVAGLILLVVLPLLPRGTSAAVEAAYAYRIAAILKSDRSAAARTGGEIATRIDVARRQIAGGSGGEITLPRDLMLEVLTSSDCARGEGAFAIVFAADARSCGGVIRLGKGSVMWRIRINWLTGFVDVVDPRR